MKTLIALCLALSLAACENLPKSGWYKNTTTAQKIYVVFVGTEDQVTGQYPDKFTKDDFVAAFAKTRSSQYINEGRPKYYAVTSAGPEAGQQMTIIAVENLERDYKSDR